MVVNEHKMYGTGRYIMLLEKQLFLNQNGWLNIYNWKSVFDVNTPGLIAMMHILWKE